MIEPAEPPFAGPFANVIAISRRVGSLPLIAADNALSQRVSLITDEIVDKRDSLGLSRDELAMVHSVQGFIDSKLAELDDVLKAAHYH